MSVDVALDESIPNMTVLVGWAPHGPGRFVVIPGRSEPVPFEGYIDRVTEDEVNILAKAIPLLWEEAGRARDLAIETLAIQTVGIAEFVQSKT